MPYRDIQSCRPINKTMSQTHEPDLTAMEGPDDWVSLFLDGANDDMLNDLEVRAQVPGVGLSEKLFRN